MSLVPHFEPRTIFRRVSRALAGCLLGVLVAGFIYGLEWALLALRDSTGPAKLLARLAGIPFSIIQGGSFALIPGIVGVAPWLLFANLFHQKFVRQEPGGRERWPALCGWSAWGTTMVGVEWAITFGADLHDLRLWTAGIATFIGMAVSFRSSVAG